MTPIAAASWRSFRWPSSALRRWAALPSGNLAQRVGVQPVLFACGLATLVVGVVGRRRLARIAA
jgi:hypothetical protein